MVSTIWSTQRVSRSYIGKRRGSKEIEVTRRRRGRGKRREKDLASNQFSKCSPQPRTPKEITELGREEKREGEDRDDLGRKKSLTRGRQQSSQ